MRTRARLPRRPAVLCYHGFADAPGPDPHGVLVRTAALREQLAHLRTTGRLPVDLDGFLAAARAGRRGRRVLVTVDDALASAVRTGIPLMLRAGVRPVLFVPAAHLGGTASWMTEQPDLPLADAEEVRALARDGVELGAHGLEHLDLRGLDDAALRRQTREAGEAVADLSGRFPASFAYPYGWYDARAKDAVRRAGYAVGFSLYTDGGRFAVSRVDVSPPDSTRAMRLKMLPGYRRVRQASDAAPGVRRAVHRVLR